MDTCLNDKLLCDLGLDIACFLVFRSTGCLRGRILVSVCHAICLVICAAIHRCPRFLGLHAVDAGCGELALTWR